MEHITRDIFRWTGKRELTKSDKEYADKLAASAEDFFAPSSKKE